DREPAVLEGLTLWASDVLDGARIPVSRARLDQHGLERFGPQLDVELGAVVARGVKRDHDEVVVAHLPAIGHPVRPAARLPDPRGERRQASLAQIVQGDDRIAWVTEQGFGPRLVTLFHSSSASDGMPYHFDRSVFR